MLGMGEMCVERENGLGWGLYIWKWCLETVDIGVKSGEGGRGLPWTG